MSERTTLVLSDTDQANKNCLGLYLLADKKRTKVNLPGNHADKDSMLFEASLEKLQSKLRLFLNSPDKQRSILVLGKIQSGKTAHMLGTLAWAVNQKIMFAVVFTGINGDLNDQTQARLKSDLGKLGDDFIKLFEVPTSSDGAAYNQLKTEIIHLINARASGNTALPVLVTMKNKYRISTVESLASDIARECGESTVALYIDDEADQASQNSGAQKRTVSVTYESFTQVRKVSTRNIWLSYTATPQAVLLTEKHGLIRPDLTVVAPPRLGYFGLSDAVSPEFEKQRIVVEDWPHGVKKVSLCPQSLKDAIHDFFFTALIRFKFNQFFYSHGDYQVSDISSKLKSVQMMIHTSNTTASHKSTFKLVSSEIETWKEELLIFQSTRLSGKANSSIENELLKSISGLLSRLDSDVPFEREDLISESAITDLIELLENNLLMVVNADPNRPNKHITFPNETHEWEESKTWIAIGGDILGRGLTLPQLVTTYFMRTAKAPNFDTVSQQMRFCGYRNAYAKITTIWAPEQTFDSFYYMSQIDNVVWNRAVQWDSSNLNMGKYLPAVMYAAPLSSRIQPTRKAVRDPDLIDSKISGELIFSTRRFMNPGFLKRNTSLVKKWISKNRSSIEVLNEWLYLENPPIDQVLELIKNWSARVNEESLLSGVAELFSDDMQSLGLSEIPISVFITEKIATIDIGSPKNLEKFNASVKFGRTVAGETKNLSLDIWKTAALDDEALGKYFDDLAITHVGGSQRKLRNHLNYDASILIVEYMNGYKTNNGLKTQISTGLAMSILSPGEYDVRVIGHST
jgi:hypothetical protein